MNARTALTLALLLSLTTLAGCIGEDTGDANAPTPTGPEEEDGRSGTPNASLPSFLPLVRIDNPEQSTEADVACAMGGGPKLPRLTDGYVAHDTTHLSLMLSTPPTSVGYLQVGYAIDADGGGHERDVEGEITWLDPVTPGETANRTVHVTPDLAEASAGDERWDFYARYTTPESQEHICYTGGKVGENRIHIDAVRGGPG